MKNSIMHKLAVLLVIPVIYFFLISGFNHSAESMVSTAPPSIQYDTNDFTNCIFNIDFEGMQLSPEFYVENNVSNYWDELHFNAVQWYDFYGHPKYGTPGVTLVDSQIYNYKSVLNQVSTKPLKGFYEKCNFSYPMYGQRLVYEVQDMPPDNTINYGFVYGYCMDDDDVYTTDGNRTVLHAVPGVNQPDYLCRNIYENFQHTDLFDFRQNDKGLWYIKPVMRIPTGLDDGLPVVTIQVVSFDSTVVKTVTINAGHFKDENGNYNGEYKSGFPEVNLQILGKDSLGCINKGRTEEFENWHNTCHVDFRVYWHGDVEVWFDKLVVDDEIANDVFAGRWNPNIDQQAEKFTNYASYYTFFTDETLISQIPCIKYVMKRMREADLEHGTAPPKFSIALNNYLHMRGLRNDNLSYKYFFDSLEVERVQMDAHKIASTTTEGYIPDVFSEHDPFIPASWFKSNN